MNRGIVSAKQNNLQVHKAPPFLLALSFLLSLLLLLLQPSPVKKERSLRPQSFCHSSSVSPQDKLSLPGSFLPPLRDKQRLSYGAFANPVYSTSSDTPPSPGPDSSGTPLAARSQRKGRRLQKFSNLDDFGGFGGLEKVPGVSRVVIRGLWILEKVS